MKCRWSICLLLFVCASLLIAGCGPKGREKPKTVKVSGTVTLNGTALDGAEVNFVGDGYAGVTNTDSTGNYEVEAQPGNNKVFIRKFEGMDEIDPTMIDASGDSGEGGGGPKSLIPEKYSVEAKTELSYSVPEEDATGANFDLTSN